MNDQERQIIAGIFQRLEQAASQPRDPETERFIADKMRAQPYAPYAMAQLIYVQEEAIKNLNQQLEEARAKGSQQSGGFLSSIFGGGGGSGSRPEPQASQRPAGSPWGQAGAGAGQPGGGQPAGGQPGGAGYGQPQPGPGYGQPGGYAPAPQGGPWGGGQPGGFAAPQGRSGFLGSALTTAAGVAGGMVVGNALMNAFGGGHHALGGLDSTAMSSLTGGAGGGLFGSSSDSDIGSSLHGGSGLQDAAFGQDAGFGQDPGFGQDAAFGPDDGLGPDEDGGDMGGDSNGGDWT